MLSKFFLVVLLCQNIYVVYADDVCRDINGKTVAASFHYVPGPEPCKLCICDYGQPKFCKAVLCAQPTDCKAYRRGNDCCEFFCLDDALSKNSNFLELPSDFSIRMLALGGTMLLFLSFIIFLIYKIRKSKAQNRRGRNHEDQRSLASIGYIGGSGNYPRQGEMTHYPVGWKPHYLPRGEAPPPYDEAVGQASAELLRGASERPTLLHRSYSVSHTVRTQDPHHYANLPTPYNEVIGQGNFSQHVPLLQATRNSSIEPETSSYTSLHDATPSTDSENFFNSTRLAHSLGTINNRSLLNVIHANDSNSLSYNGPNLLQIASNPRTPARSSNLADQVLQNSFYLTSQHRSHPRFEMLQASLALMDESPSQHFNEGSLRNSSRSIRRDIGSEGLTRYSPPRSSVNDNCLKLRNTSKMRFDESKIDTNIKDSAILTFPTKIDKPSCECSYNSQASSTATEELDDFRNECVNCKTSTSSRWHKEEHVWKEPNTLSLRRPPSTPRNQTVTTLPSRPSKSTEAPLPKNWESWFNTGGETSSDEE